MTALVLDLMQSPPRCILSCMTSNEIKASINIGNAEDNQGIWLREIAYQLAVMNETRN
jgi:hypothetical protein